MKIIIILAYGYKLINVISHDSKEDISVSISSYIINSNKLNENEKEKYVKCLKESILELLNFQICNLVNYHDTYMIEIFINPYKYNYPMILCDKHFTRLLDMNSILHYANNFYNNEFLRSKISQYKEKYENGGYVEIYRKNIHETKTKTECPICFDDTLCYKFFKCNHVQCFDCYLQMNKLQCIYKCHETI
jgi:hypothetical protein